MVPESAVVFCQTGLHRVECVLLWGGRTVEVEGMADSSQDDSVGYLGKEVILEIGVVDHR